MNVVFQGDVAVRVQLRWLFGQVLHPGAGWNRAKILLDQAQCFHRVDVAADGQGRVVRAIPAQEKAFKVGDISPVQVFHPTNHRPGIRVSFRIHGSIQSFKHKPVGPIVIALATFILDRFTLNLEFLLGHRIQQQAHTISFQPQGRFKVVDRQCFEIVGAIRVGAAIHRAAGVGNDLEMLIIAHVFRSLEHHVLEEVCKTGTSNLFAVGADMVGHVHVHQRIGVILMQDNGQAIVKLVLGVGDGDTTVITFEFIHQRESFRQGRRLVGRFGPRRDLFVVGFAGRQYQQQRKNDQFFHLVFRGGTKQPATLSQRRT